ncbi:hypothetical protein [Helicobacter felis]|uniref:hypothetical protein n=1 Tax=Helicobacter felis TaxID=214 RepID=UPI000CEE7FE2|nr:hypothetical protein [Helicobacter felis]
MKKTEVSEVKTKTPAYAGEHKAILVVFTTTTTTTIFFAMFIAIGVATIVIMIIAHSVLLSKDWKLQFPHSV